jgi:8-oxo-dGTP pyrophosphatase MutT (NUDIX family)
LATPVGQGEESAMDPVFRQAARLLVVDQDNSVLLFQYEDDRRTWWAAPGGGLERDETFEQAAAREAAEELVLTLTTFTPLWCQAVDFKFRGKSIRQVERYFLVRVARKDVAPGDVVGEAHRLEGIVAARWWSLQEIETTSEQVFPEHLHERLRGLQPWSFHKGMRVGAHWLGRRKGRLVDNVISTLRRVLGTGLTWAWLAFWTILFGVIAVVDPDSIDPGETTMFIVIFGPMGFFSGLAFPGSAATARVASLGRLRRIGRGRVRHYLRGCEPDEERNAWSGRGSCLPAADFRLGQSRHPLGSSRNGGGFVRRFHGSRRRHACRRCPVRRHVAIVVPARGRKVHVVRFWLAFREFKHGKDRLLRAAEADLDRCLRGSVTPGKTRGSVAGAWMRSQ